MSNKTQGKNRQNSRKKDGFRKVPIGNKTFDMRPASIGAYYRDDKDDGFGLTFSIADAGQHVVTVFHDMVQDAFDGAERERQELGQSVERFGKDLLAQTTEDIIPWINTHLHGTPTQPLPGGFEMDLSDEELLKMVSVFFMNINWLSHYKLITDDNHNGMTFSYRTK